MLSKGAIREVPWEQRVFLSNIFLVEKKDKGWRPVINLRDLNKFLTYNHFKMEGIHLLKDMLLEKDWLVKLDLKDAYFTIPMAEESQPFLQFTWKNLLYQFQALPFGLSSAPWCFTEVMKAITTVLRERGIRLIIYLDDILIMSQDHSQILQDLKTTVELIESTGFIINREKSIMTLSRSLEFLGFTVDTVKSMLLLPAKKISKIRKEIRHVLNSESLTLRELARLLGLLSSSIQAIFPGPLHYRALQRLKGRALRSGLWYGDKIHLDKEAQVELTWWLENLDAWNGKAIFGTSPYCILESDASLHGWGAFFQNQNTGGLWSYSESLRHINYLELTAGLYALMSFRHSLQGRSVVLKMDSVSAVAYINRLGGTRSPDLSNLAKKLWMFCLEHQIYLKAEYLPGLKNVCADWNSRFLVDHTDWKLSVNVFKRLDYLGGPLEVDLFASRLTTQLPSYFSWMPDSGALAVDAFLRHWRDLRGYVFPPFAMIQRVLQKLREERSSIVLVTPFWPSQPWFPTTLELVYETPFLIPASPGLLKDIDGWDHPLLLNGTLNLLAWRVSGEPTKSLAFRRKLLLSSKNLGPPVHTLDTTVFGRDGFVGAWKGTWIPWRHLLYT